MKLWLLSLIFVPFVFPEAQASWSWNCYNNSCNCSYVGSHPDNRWQGIKQSNWTAPAEPILTCCDGLSQNIVKEDKTITFERMDSIPIEDDLTDGNPDGLIRVEYTETRNVITGLTCGETSMVDPNLKVCTNNSECPAGQGCFAADSQYLFNHALVDENAIAEQTTLRETFENNISTLKKDKPLDFLCQFNGFESWCEEPRQAGFSCFRNEQCKSYKCNYATYRCENQRMCRYAQFSESVGNGVECDPRYGMIVKDGKCTYETHAPYIGLIETMLPLKDLGNCQYDLADPSHRVAAEVAMKALRAAEWALATNTTRSHWDCFGKHEDGTGLAKVFRDIGGELKGKRQWSLAKLSLRLKKLDEDFAATQTVSAAMSTKNTQTVIAQNQNKPITFRGEQMTYKLLYEKIASGEAALRLMIERNNAYDEYEQEVKTYTELFVERLETARDTMYYSKVHGEQVNLSDDNEHYLAQTPFIGINYWKEHFYGDPNVGWTKYKVWKSYNPVTGADRNYGKDKVLGPWHEYKTGHWWYKRLSVDEQKDSCRDVDNRYVALRWGKYYTAPGSIAPALMTLFPDAQSLFQSALLNAANLSGEGWVPLNTSAGSVNNWKVWMNPPTNYYLRLIFQDNEMALNSRAAIPHYYIDPLLPGEKWNMDTFAHFGSGSNDNRKALNGTTSASLAKIRDTLFEWFKADFKAQSTTYHNHYEPELLVTLKPECLKVENMETPQCKMYINRYISEVVDYMMAQFITWGYRIVPNYAVYYFKQKTSLKNRLFDRYKIDFMNLSTYYTAMYDYRSKTRSCLDGRLNTILCHYSGNCNTSTSSSGGNPNPSQPGGLGVGYAGVNYDPNQYGNNTTTGGSQPFHGSQIKPPGLQHQGFDFTNAVMLGSGTFNENMGTPDYKPVSTAGANMAGTGSQKFNAIRERALKEKNEFAKKNPALYASLEKMNKDTINALKDPYGSMLKSLKDGAGKGGEGNTTSGSGKSNSGSGASTETDPNAGKNMVADAEDTSMTRISDGSENGGSSDPYRIDDGGGSGGNGGGGRGYNYDGNSGGAGGGATAGYGADGKLKNSALSDSDQENILTNLDRNQGRYEGSDGDSLFETVTKAYMRNLNRVLERETRPDSLKK